MNTKKFDPKLYKMATAKVEGAMIPWLEREGYTDIETIENYGVDVRCKKDGLPHSFELELNKGWKEKKWPERFELKVPFRKKKSVLDKWADGELTFITFSLDCTQAWFIDGKIVKEAPIVKRSNSYVLNKLFFLIDRDKAEIKQMKKQHDPDLDNNSKYPS